MALIAAAIAVGAGTAMKGVASAQQAKALGKASRIQGAYQDRLLGFQQQVYDEAQPFRDISLKYARAGEEALPQLSELALNPTMSAGYGLASREGLKSLQQNFATQGAPDSGPAAIAAGRFSVGLSANERDRQIDTLYRLAGFGNLAPGQANAALNTSASLLESGRAGALSLAQLAAAKGANNAALIGGLGEDLIGLGTMGFGNMKKPLAGGTPTTGASTGGAGLSAYGPYASGYQFPPENYGMGLNYK